MEAEVSLQQEPVHSKDSRTILAPSQLYQRDPLLVLLKDKWRLNTFWFIVGCSLFVIGLFFGLHALAGLPFTPRGNLLRVLDTFTCMLFFGVYFYLPDSIAGIFNKLVSCRTIDIDNPHQGQATPTSYEVLLTRFISWMNSPLWLILTLPFVLSYFLYRLLVPSVPLSIGVSQLIAPNYPLWQRLTDAFIDILLAYTSVLSIVRISVALYFLYRLFNSFTIRINPLHQDGAGGLGILRLILWNSAAIMLAITLAFYEDSIHWSKALDIALLVGAYAILIPSLLLGWLILPHRAMLQARNTVLEPLTDEYNKISSELKSVANDDTATIMAKTERLSALTERYNLCRNTFPVWPLEIVQMRQLTLVIILPLLVAVISALPSIPSIIGYFTKKP